MEPPTKEDTRTDRRQSSEDNGIYDEVDDGDDNYGDLEYLIDGQESREMNDPFHILLLGSTFDAPKMTVSYVSGSLEYVLQMPLDEAKELSMFSQEHGLACLGTWERQECLKLGRQLQMRNLVCRVVPYCPGGQRGWQAKDAAGNSASSSSSSGNGEGWN